MRRIILCCLAIALFVAAPLRAQPDSLWSRTYGGDRRDDCRSIIQCDDGGYALAGLTYSFGAGDADFYLVRTNENGDTIWTRTYGGESSDRCYSLVQTADGGYVLAGYTESFGAGGEDIWLVRTDGNGDSLWSRTFGGQDDDVCHSIIKTTDGGFALAGSTSSFGAGGYDFWLMKTDEAGDSIWSRTYGTEGSEGCNSLIQTMDGGYALAGWTLSSSFEFHDFLLVRTDDIGDSLWSCTYDGGYLDACHSLVQTADGGFALAGFINLFHEGWQDFWIVRTDESGDSLWSATFGGAEHERCTSLTQTADGGFALAGYTYSFGAGIVDFYLVKLGPENSVPGSDFILHPSSFILLEAYPNPFNSQAVSSYKLQVSSWVTLCLYDLRGQLVAALMDGWQEAGEHRVVIDANGGQPGMAVLPSGIYLLRLSDGRQTALSKACVVR